MTTFCPHCGYDLRQDEVIVSGRMTYDPRGALLWDGEEMPLQGARHAIIGTLLKARGRYVSAEVIAERVGYEGEKGAQSIRVQIFRIRQMIPDIPIRAMQGVGYRWVQ